MDGFDYRRGKNNQFGVWVLNRNKKRKGVEREGAGYKKSSKLGSPRWRCHLSC